MEQAFESVTLDLESLSSAHAANHLFSPAFAASAFALHSHFRPRAPSCAIPLHHLRRRRAPILTLHVGTSRRDTLRQCCFWSSKVHFQVVQGAHPKWRCASTRTTSSTERRLVHPRTFNSSTTFNRIGDAILCLEGHFRRASAPLYRQCSSRWRSEREDRRRQTHGADHRGLRWQ